MARSGSPDPEDVARAGIAVEVHARAVPMIIQAATLDRVVGVVGVKEPSALAFGIALARVDKPLRTSCAQSPGERLGLAVTVRIERCRKRGSAAAQIVQRCIQVHHQLAKL